MNLVRRSLTREAFPLRRLVGVFVVLSIVPLALLTYLSSRIAGDAVRDEAEARMLATASITARLIEQELGSLAELVDSYAERPHLVEASAGAARRGPDRDGIRFHLAHLRRSREGIYTTFLAQPDGRLVDIVPSTPEIVGKDFSFRDWYKGATRTGRPYISAAYETQAAGRPLVVAAAALVRNASGKTIGVLVAAYSVDYLQDFSNELAGAQAVELEVTDQRGVLVAATGEGPRALVSRRDDARVAAALAGRSGTMEVESPDGSQLSAYAPASGIGWTATASVPADTAFAAVGKLRSTVLGVSAVLGAVLLGGLFVLARALRARSRAEEDAHRQATINRAVLDASLDGIRLVDPEGKSLVTNAAMERMSEELLRLPHEGSIPERILALADRTTDPETYRATTREMLADPEFEGVYEYEFADTGRWVERYTKPVRDDGGNRIGRLFLLREVTAEREAERLKSELVATVSHELRTPLASILGFAELLAERDPPAETRDRYVRTIHGEAKRLTELINDFLDLQRMEEGRFRLTIEPFDLREVLTEVVELFSGQSESHTIALALPPDPLPVAGERDRIGQVVGNLVSNAIKYSPAGGVVDVAATTSDGVARVSVRDSGLGIPLEQQRKIFTKFFRVDSSDTRRIGGTGLGLALCREIVEAHGGRIGFRSVPGDGSTFWFELPAVQRTNGASARRVLVIEDDPAAAALLTEYLRDDGYAVDAAASGEAGLALAEERPPALVCLDLTLQGELDGWEVLARLKGSPSTANVPVVVCTAGNGRDRAAALAAADFLTKPFPARRLREAIERLFPDGRGRVLVVDDDESVRALVRETLGDQGLELQEAADGGEALAAVAAERPDAIVLDLTMPKVDGFTVLERLREDPETRTIPVVVLTARRLSEEERGDLSARAVSLLAKSDYSAGELRRLIQQALGNEAPHRAHDAVAR